METTGQKIKLLRTEKNISQEELASALGVSRQAVSKWEQDQVLITLEKLRDISRFFGVTMESLVATDGSDIKVALSVSEKKRLETIECKVKAAVSGELIDGIKDDVSHTVEQAIVCALRRENTSGISNSKIDALKECVAAKAKHDIAKALDEDIDKPKEKPKFGKPSKAWIAGTAISSLFPFSFIVVVIVRAILSSLYISTSDARWSYLNWAAWITYIVLVCIASAVLIGFIVYRVIKYVLFEKSIK